MNKARMAALSLGTLLALLLTGGAWAGSSTHYAVDWQVLSGGGAPAAFSSGAMTLNGSLGQTAIGLSSAAGDNALGAGYWYGTLGGKHQLYLPLVLRNH